MDTKSPPEALAAAQAAARQADNETIEAMITAMADHPGVPQVMRDSMPALMRSMRQRDQAMADLVAAVESLRHLVAGTQPTPG